MTKLRSKGQIPWLGSKFRGPRKTVGPVNYADLLLRNYSLTHVEHVYQFVDSDHTSVGKLLRLSMSPTTTPLLTVKPTVSDDDFL